MESTLKKIKQNKHELTVEVGREELEKYVKLAETRIAQALKVDGFRKGKAPRELIRKEIGDEKILQEALDIALQDTLATAIDRQSLEVLKAVDLNVKENSPTKLVYSINLSLFPDIKIGDLSKLKIKKGSVSVDRKEIEEALESLVLSRAKFIPEDKKAEKGDRVEVDFEVTSGGLPIENGMSKNHPVVIGDNKFIPGFEEALIGMTKDEEKKFTLTAPKDYFHKSVAGRALDFKVKVVSVQKIERPEINDDFARGLGRFKDLKDLEQNISAGILQEKKMKESQKLRLEILAGIASKSKVELPDDMVRERLDEMVSNFDRELHQKDMELSLYLAHLGKTEDSLRKDWQKEAEKQVSFALILKKIAKDKNLQPSQGEIEETSNLMIQNLSLQGGVDSSKIDLEAVREAAATNLLNEKVFEYLEKNYSA